MRLQITRGFSVPRVPHRPLNLKTARARDSNGEPGSAGRTPYFSGLALEWKVSKVTQMLVFSDAALLAVTSLEQGFLHRQKRQENQ
jgi:hypothetical protein